MRIIHELQAGRKLATGGGVWSKPGPPPVRGVVSADEIAAWYWKSEHQVWEWLHDFGPLIPPFDTMWIEFAYPPAHEIVVPDDHPGIGDMEAFAVYLREGPRMEAWSEEQRATMASRSKIATAFDDNDRTMTLYPIARMRGFGLFSIPCFWQVVTSTEGEFKDIVTLYTSTLKESSVEHLHPHEILLTLSFMNVVNSRRDDEPEHRSTVKALKKKGVIPIAMNRIRLPAARSSSRADVKAATGGTMPLHLVRGHFKTYTPDAPLFGKSTGTYWWGWQSRGKAERGVRGHTYEVGPGG